MNAGNLHKFRSILNREPLPQPPAREGVLPSRNSLSLQKILQNQSAESCRYLWRERAPLASKASLPVSPNNVPQAILRCTAALCPYPKKWCELH